LRDKHHSERPLMSNRESAQHETQFCLSTLLQVICLPAGPNVVDQFTLLDVVPFPRVSRIRLPSFD